MLLREDRKHAVYASRSYRKPLTGHVSEELGIVSQYAILISKPDKGRYSTQSACRRRVEASEILFYVTRIYHHTKRPWFYVGTAFDQSTNIRRRNLHIKSLSISYAVVNCNYPPLSLRMKLHVILSISDSPQFEALALRLISASVTPPPSQMQPSLQNVRLKTSSACVGNFCVSRFNSYKH